MADRQRVTVVGWRQPAISGLLKDEVEVQLLTAAHLHNARDRNTDATDSAWIARLVEHDLARASFVPPPPDPAATRPTGYRAALARERTREK
jgi:hypothetical protein